MRRVGRPGGTRQEAKLAGRKRYFTGEPCRHGHVCERFVSSKGCVECAAIRFFHFRKEHPEKVRRYISSWRARNSQRVKEVARLNYVQHREKRRIYNRNYRLTHQDYFREYDKKYKAQYKRSPQQKLADLLRTRLRVALKGRHKSGSAVRDLGCSIEYLMAYFVEKFETGMCWENHGKTWHIDHIKPLASFDLTKRKQLLKACHYTNLQPLSIEDHKLKHFIRSI